MKKVDIKIEERELQVVDYLKSKWNCHIEYTGRNLFSRVDGFIFKDNQLKGICAIQCRRQSLSWMKDYKSVIISYPKLTLGADLSRLLGVKYFVMIYTCDNQIIQFEITDKKGNIVCPMYIKPSVLPKSTNFEEKVVHNAYLDIENKDYCKIYNRGYE